MEVPLDNLPPKTSFDIRFEKSDGLYLDEARNYFSLAELHDVDHAFSSHYLAAVLREVVRYDQTTDQRHLEIEHARNAIRIYPDLRRAVIETVFTRRFSALRAHNKLHMHAPPVRPLPPSPPLASRADREASARAWKRQFLGNYHIRMLKDIDEMNTIRNREKPYANFVPIIQASGTGKSRTLDQLAMLLFAVPMNLSNPDNDEAFPPGDPALHTFFKIKNDETVQSASMWHCKYLAFFENTFIIVKTILESKMKGNVHFPESASLAEWWREYLAAEEGRFRKNLFQQVVTTADHHYCRDIQVARKQAFQSARQLLEVLEVFIQRENSLYQGRDTKRFIRLLIYVDESHLLSDLPEPLYRAGCETPYQVFIRCMNEFQSLDIFAVFLSTNSSLSSLAPPRFKWFSRRVREDTEDHVQTPLVEIPFDIWKTHAYGVLVRENDMTLAQMCTLEVMVRFGRIMFWTRYEAGDEAVRQDIFNFAVLKLAGVPVTRLEDIMKTGKLAAIANRVLLEFDSSLVDAVMLEIEMVQGHMRIVFSIPKHREYLRSGFPSEPVLSEAAARIMNGVKDSSPNDWASLIAEQVKQGLLDKGQAGELVMRMLLTFAHDAAVVKMAGSKAAVTRWDVPILLIDFLEALLGTENTNKVLAATPDNMHGQSLADAFKGAYVRFTHFVKGYDHSVITDKAMWQGLARGMAYQGWNGQRMIDIAIPVALWNTKLGRWMTTAVFFQLKNTIHETLPTVDIEDLNFFSPGGPAYANKRPFIIFTANVGVRKAPSTIVEEIEALGKHRPSTKHRNSGKTKAPQGESPVVASVAEIPRRVAFATPPKNSRKRKASEAGLKTPKTPHGVKVRIGATREQPERPSKKKKVVSHPRYAIDLLGCGPCTYAVIGADNSEVWAKLLGRRSLLEEHPRQHRDNIMAVVNTKPFFSEYLGTDSWAESNSAYPPTEAEPLRNVDAEEIRFRDGDFHRDNEDELMGNIVEEEDGELEEEEEAEGVSVRVFVEEDSDTESESDSD